MQMDRPFIEDLVDRAADLVAMDGPEAFSVLRDRKGPFVFMDTYVFVITPEGVELVNPAFPALQGQNMLELTDLKGEPVVKKEIELAMNQGSGWLDMYWYVPGKNTMGIKHTYVRKVEHKGSTYILGSGFFNSDEPVK
jgi:signal transduction histidine kinase